MLHIGDYKSASNTFTENGFTPAHREMSASMNRDWYDELVARRRRRPEDVRGRREAGDRRRAVSRRGSAQAPGWSTRSPTTISSTTTGRFVGRGSSRRRAYVRSDDNFGAAGAPRIALIYAVGTITSGESAADALGSVSVGSDSFLMWMRRARLDPNVRAVVVRIDSPGGSAIASEVMWREIKLTRDVKPVVVSMGDVAASGGYYIAAPAHAIVAQPGTHHRLHWRRDRQVRAEGLGGQARHRRRRRERRPDGADLFAVPAVLAGRARPRRRADEVDLRSLRVAGG